MWFQDLKWISYLLAMWSQGDMYSHALIYPANAYTNTMDLPMY